MTPLPVSPPRTEAERIDWLRLIRSENVGPVTFIQLLRHYGSAGAALAALPKLAERGGMARRIRIAEAGEARRELDAAADAGAEMLCLGAAAYPRLLALIDAPPPVLWARGHVHLLSDPAVAIVGARNASAAGQRMAQQIAAGLGERRVVVASGLARGIDTAAHRASLATGTAAVLAGGVDDIYPPENAGLYAELAETGCIVSEMPMGMKPQGRHFPRRNRIISGLSYGTVVIEAARQSGSLTTARFAADQGREVMAVPGSPLDPRCHGSNRLLKDGATLVQSADDVLDTLRPIMGGSMTEPDSREPLLPFPAPPAEEMLADARAAVTSLLGPTPVEIDELVRMSGLTPPVVSMILLELELAGRLERHAGHQVSLI